MSYISNTSDQLHILDSAEDLRQHAINLTRQTKRQLYLFSPRLNPYIFNDNEFIDALSRLARRSRASDIRIIICDASVLLNTHHRILPLSHRLTSTINIKKLAIEPPTEKEFILLDHDKVWLQHKPEETLGFANYSSAADVKHLRIEFDELWKNSVDDPSLRQLLL